MQQHRPGFQSGGCRHGGSPISGNYLSALSIFASYGYVVVAPFHGDLRFTVLKIEDLCAAIALLTNLSDFTALQALRPLSVSAALDNVLAKPQWRDHIDATQIGGFGASMGAETIMLLGGAGLTTSYFDFGSSWKQVTRDPRIKAAVGYVPYFGQPVLPAFGRDQRGLDNISLPFLSISGTADTVAPITEVESGMSRLAGTRELVALSGVQQRRSERQMRAWAKSFGSISIVGALLRISPSGGTSWWEAPRFSPWRRVAIPWTVRSPRRSARRSVSGRSTRRS